MLRRALIVLATGRDRPGIVDRIAGVSFEAGANLEDSRMAILGGEFALVALLAGAPESLERVKVGMSALSTELGLTVELKEAEAGPGAREDVAPHLRYAIHGVAMDHPGIVHRVAHVLAHNGVNVARLDTSLSHAPVSGAPIFSLSIEAEVPADLPIPRLRAELQEVAEEENIDLDLRPLA